MPRLDDGLMVASNTGEPAVGLVSGWLSLALRPTGAAVGASIQKVDHEPCHPAADCRWLVEAQDSVGESPRAPELLSGCLRQLRSGLPARARSSWSLNAADTSDMVSNELTRSSMASPRPSLSVR